MRDKVHIGWCPIEKIPELQVLIDQHWRKNHILSYDEALLKWQYRHLTKPDHLAIMIAQNQAGEIIGCLGLIQLPFNDRGKQRLALWMSMWLLVPEARGQGIGFALLEQAIKENYEVIACIGFNDITRRLVDGLNFEIQDTVPRWVRPISLQNLYQLTAAREQPYSPEIQRMWEKTSMVYPESAGSVEDWTLEGSQLWNTEWHQQFAPQWLSTWHDREYIEWRYLHHPSFTYAIRLSFRDVNQVNGLLVYRIENIQQREEKVLRIVELLGNADALDGLIADVLNAARVHDTAFIDFYCTATNFSAKLEQHGFYRDDQQNEQDRLPRLFQPLDFRTKPLNITFWIHPDIHPDSHEYFAGDALYFTRADGDQDRPN